MMRWIAFSALVLLLSGMYRAGLAQDNPLVGSWESRDPASSEVLSMTITPTQITIEGEGPPVGYGYEAAGNVITMRVEDPNAPPVTFTVIDPDTLELRFPDSPPLMLTRVAAAPGAAQAPQAGAGAEPAAGALPEAAQDQSLAGLLLPRGVDTRYEPAGASLEQMLNDGWAPQQSSGVQGGMTMLLRNGSHYVFCILVPKDFGESSTALSDCRKLN